MIFKNQKGTIYYTTDDSDPRQIGGSVSPNAKTYDQPFELKRDTVLSARVWLDGDWSALSRAQFTIE